ncbi:MAG: DUF6076 domain-containing protein [Acutalibacteraceae bacterium]|nr:DUF6076 domain-containing protein [Acutalibacteraceae bacterium]
MSKDYSEYKASKYDEYLKVRTPDNGTSLNVFNNNVIIDCDSQIVKINIDTDNEYFNQAYCILDFGDEFDANLKRHTEIVRKLKNLSADFTDYEKKYEDRQNLNFSSGKISFDFSDERTIRANYYYMDYEVDIPEKINIFSCSSVKLDLGEGIFDFIYADFKTPLNRLISLYESIPEKDIFKSISHKIYSERQKDYEMLMELEKTILAIKPMLYSSIYSGICPPRFDFDYDFIEQLKWYGNYLINLQKEYAELIQFCYDKDCYPQLLLGANPMSRYYLYKYAKGLPMESIRTEMMSFTNYDPEGNYKIKDTNYSERYYKELFNKEHTLKNLDFVKESDVSVTFMTGILLTYRNITESYVFRNVDEILELELTKMLKSNIRIKRCKRCGKYFRLKGNYHTDYCSRIAEGEGRNCREIAASEKYKSKMANNQALKIYNKYYKRYMARVKVKQLKEEKFLDWQYESLSMRYACEREAITVEEYIDFNESFFPNRKKKETK